MSSTLLAMEGSDPELVELLSTPAPAPRVWSARWTVVVASLASVALLASATFVTARRSLTLAAAGGQVQLSGGVLSACGAYGPDGRSVDASEVSDFSSKETMLKHGWTFDAASLTFAYNPPLNLREGHQHDVPAGAYYGWDWPGDLSLHLKLRGRGTVKVKFGDLHFEGNVTTYLDGVDIKDMGGYDGPGKGTIAFEDGQVLTFKEGGESILVVEHLHFTCDAPHSHDVFTETLGTIARMDSVNYEVADASLMCGSSCMAGTDEAVVWNPSSATAYIDRTWCATRCNMLGLECMGFLYPKIDMDKPRCVLVTNACEGKLLSNLCYVRSYHNYYQKKSSSDIKEEDSTTTQSSEGIEVTSNQTRSSSDIEEEDSTTAQTSEEREVASNQNKSTTDIEEEDSTTVEPGEGSEVASN